MAARVLASREDARDLRTGGMWSPGQRVKNALIRGLVVSALALVDRVPERWLLRLGRALGRAAYWLLNDLRARALARIRLAGSERDTHRLGRSSFERAGESLAVSLLLRRPETRALDFVRVPERTRALLEGALAQGRGAIVVSAHLGPFELIPAAVAELGLRPAVVVRESYDPRLDRLVDAHRLVRGVTVIHRGRAHASTRILRALREGRPVGILPDLGGRVPCRPTEFLGAEVGFPVGPARLARRLDVPLLALTLRRISGEPRYELFSQPIAAGEDRSEDSLTQCVADALAGAVREQPESWLWMAGKQNAGLQKNQGTR